MTRRIPDYTQHIINALRDDHLGFTAEVVGTGGGCEAIEVRHENHPGRYLLITDDAALPEGRPSVTELVIASYIDGQDDEPETVFGYEPDERVTHIIRTAVAALGEWEQLS